MQHDWQSLETLLADNQRKLRYFQQCMRFNLPYDKQLAEGLLFTLKAYQELKIHQGALSTYFNCYIYYHFIELMEQDQIEQVGEDYYLNEFNE